MEDHAIDDRLPVTAAQGVEIAFAITAQPLGLREEVRIRVTTIEQSDVVTPLKRALDDRAAKKLRAAEDEEAHGSTISNPERLREGGGWLR